MSDGIVHLDLKTPGELLDEIMRLRKALEKIAAMDPKGIRADDLGQAARIAADQLGDAT